jgi:hypothetical protein
MRPLGAILVAGMLAGCGTAYNPQSSAYRGAQDAKKHDFIGTKRYATRTLYMCPAAMELEAGCPTLKPGAAFTVTGTAPGKYGGLSHFEVNDGQHTGYIKHLDTTFGSDSETAHQKKLADAADCKRRGGVGIGMTSAQVEASCWGKPGRINSTITARGRREQWVYGSNYVYVENGVVTAIQTASR